MENEVGRRIQIIRFNKSLPHYSIKSFIVRMIPLCKRVYAGGMYITRLHVTIKLTMSTLIETTLSIYSEGL